MPSCCIHLPVPSSLGLYPSRVMKAINQHLGQSDAALSCWIYSMCTQEGGGERGDGLGEQRTATASDITTVKRRKAVPA